MPQDRLATTDEKGRRVYLYPSEVRGKYRQRRNILNGILILIFLGLPWARFGGHQAVLIDVLHRRFAFFGILFWSHDLPILFFLVSSAILGLAFVTAIWGRIWCGWACPQTVFIDGVFRKIERWIEGDSVTRKRRDSGPWSFDKGVRRTLKWLVFLGCAMVISHSLLAYFVGTQALREMVHRSPVTHPLSFLFMAAVTAGVLFDFGWFREQFCVVVCPYGRFQSVLMDAHSMAVTYDAKRGEPRGDQGDCVNCFRCVQVCPTGIDIRRGVQMECIACTACMDACDDVMSRLKRPLGLIRYDRLSGKDASKTRGLVYLGILCVLLSGLAWSVSSRKSLAATFVRAIEAPYQEIRTVDGKGSEIVNHFKVDLMNQSFGALRVQIELGAAFRAQGGALVSVDHDLALEAGTGKRVDLFVRFPASLLRDGRSLCPILVQGLAESGQKISLTEEVPLVGPLASR